jgi:hypothetical protein
VNNLDNVRLLKNQCENQKFGDGKIWVIILGATFRSAKKANLIYFHALSRRCIKTNGWQLDQRVMVAVAYYMILELAEIQDIK